MFQEVRSFRSPGEYADFLSLLEISISSGDLSEVPVDPRYGPGELYGGRWFRVAETGEVWRLLEPDFPFRGRWERVRSSSHA